MRLINKITDEYSFDFNLPKHIRNISYREVRNKIYDKEILKITFKQTEQ